MTDRELLELAAKAAGIDIHPDEKGLWLMTRFETWDEWNPLEDDGDALRLAVKLDIDIRQDGNTVEAYGALAGQDIFATERSAPNPYAATRRAIVRAAAALGESQQSNQKD